MHLVQSFVSTGSVNFQTHTPVTSIGADPNRGYIVETPRGITHATQVVHANNAYVSALLPEYKQNIVPCKGICCRITAPEDGSIIVGGALAKFKLHRNQWYGNVDDSILIDAAKEYYNDYMQRTYRGWENTGAKVVNIWIGVMGYSYDSNPHVGAVPGKPGQFITAGWNGHGMPAIWLSGKALAKMVSQGIPFEKAGLPRLFKTTQFRIDRARNRRGEDGDILGENLVLPYVAE
ncbi:hypothetical protein G7Y89_g2515 [Cudoniella acicularis]|uniref:FAD dependent oxidoreductase domain-containing protein n=1 Tax=Cudoniella acicularis TaxID=354080 RepID=A0A8H4W8J8_9HELO|nr:hypothetical protein G7Y89_g2515 [Cudoniella acicularis]